MVVRRDSLRAQTDFFSPMTGNTSPRFAGSPKGKYSDEVKSRMAGMGEVRSTRTNPIQAAFVELIKTEDPFTEIDTKKSYAPEEEEGLAEALGGIGDGTSDVGERVEEFLAPVTGGGGGGNKPNLISRNPNDRISSMSTQQLVDRDNRMYGNTFPSGSMGSGSKSTIESSPGSKVDTNTSSLSFLNDSVIVADNAILTYSVRISGSLVIAELSASVSKIMTIFLIGIPSFKRFFNT